MQRYFVSAFLGLLLAIPVSAIQFSHEITPTSGVVGDIFEYTQTLKYSDPKTADNMILPAEEGPWGVFEILDMQRQEGQAEDGQIQVQRTYTLSVYELGDLLIPTQSVQYLVYDELKTIEAPAITVSIQSLLTEGEALPPLAQADVIPVPWRRVLTTVALVLFALALGVALWRFRRSRPSSVPEANWMSTEISPFVILQRDLEALNHEQWIQKGDARRHYHDLAIILRRFFSRYLQESVMELTREELKRVLKARLSQIDILPRVDHFLQQIDGIRFSTIDAKQLNHEALRKELLSLIHRLEEPGE